MTLSTRHRRAMRKLAAFLLAPISHVPFVRRNYVARNPLPSPLHIIVVRKASRLMHLSCLARVRDIRECPLTWFQTWKRMDEKTRADMGENRQLAERERERREGEEGDKNNERHNEEEEQTRRGT